MRAAGVLGAAAIVTTVGNLAFSVLVARSAGPAQYGGIGALLSLTAVVGFLATGIQYAAARETAASRTGGAGVLRGSFVALLPWLAVCASLLLLAVPVSAFLGLGGPLAVALTVGTFAVMLLGAPPIGVLVGRGRFGALAWISVGGVALRIAAGVVLARGGRAVEGALLASLITFALMGVAALWLASTASLKGLQEPPAGPAAARISSDSAVGSLLAGALWAAWSLPLLAGRHLLDPAASGDFAAAHLISGGVIYVSGPIVTAFFPSIVRTPTVRTVGAGLLVTVGVALAGTAGAVVVAPPMATALYGREFHVDDALVAVLSLSATAVAVMTYIVWASRAAGRRRATTTAAVVAGLLAEVVLTVTWHSSALVLAAGPGMAMSLAGLAAGVAGLGPRIRVHPWPAPSPAPAPELAPRDYWPPRAHLQRERRNSGWAPSLTLTSALVSVVALVPLLIAAALFVSRQRDTATHAAPPAGVREVQVGSRLSGPLAATPAADGGSWITEIPVLGGDGLTRIAHVGSDGRVRELTIPGRNAEPTAIAEGADGTVWVLESGVGAVVAVAADGRARSYAVLSPASYPTGITIAPDGAVWFTDERRNTVSRLQADGSVRRFPVTTPTSGLRGITIGADGNVWFTEAAAGRVGRVTRAGVVEEFQLPTRDGGPLDIVRDGPMLDVLENHAVRLALIDAQGNVREVPLQGRIRDPRGLSLGPGGHLWLVDATANELIATSTDGTITVRHLATQLVGLQATAVLPEGQVLVTEHLTGRVVLVTP